MDEISREDFMKFIGEITNLHKTQLEELHKDFEDIVKPVEAFKSDLENGRLKAKSLIFSKTPRKKKQALTAIQEGNSPLLVYESVGESVKKKRTGAARRKNGDETVLLSDAESTIVNAPEKKSRSNRSAVAPTRMTRSTALLIKQERISAAGNAEQTFTYVNDEETITSPIAATPQNNSKAEELNVTRTLKRPLLTSASTTPDVPRKRKSKSGERLPEPREQPRPRSQSLVAADERTISIMKSPVLGPIHKPVVNINATVRQAVQAYEALNGEASGSKAASHEFIPPKPVKPVRVHAPPPPQLVTLPDQYLEDPLDAPKRVTRTKSRALAKAAEEKKQNAIESEKSKANTPFPSSPQPLASKLRKPEASAKEPTNTVPRNAPNSTSKVNPLARGMSPLRWNNLLSPAPPGSNLSNFGFNTPPPSQHSNIVTSVHSFLKPAPAQEPKQKKEDNLSKLNEKAEAASKKKEELIRAAQEELMRKREEKRLKVAAQREALEREKLEQHQRLEREKEEKQRQLQLEREEKLKQEALKKKRLAMQKAAEIEERRRQEEANRVAKLKDQEEEQRRIAAQRKKEQEEAERRHFERLQQQRAQQERHQQLRMQKEREAAAQKAQEAERATKESSKTAQFLDQTYEFPKVKKVASASNPNDYGLADLETDDSSDDEGQPKKRVPDWARSSRRNSALKSNAFAPKVGVAVFYGSRKCTPDLRLVFPNIDRRQLIRKSSAVWTTPPNKRILN